MGTGGEADHLPVELGCTGTGFPAHYAIDQQAYRGGNNMEHLPERQPDE